MTIGPLHLIGAAAVVGLGVAVSASTRAQRKRATEEEEAALAPVILKPPPLYAKIPTVIKPPPLYATMADPAFEGERDQLFACIAGLQRMNPWKDKLKQSASKATTIEKIRKLRKDCDLAYVEHKALKARCYVRVRKECGETAYFFAAMFLPFVAPAIYVGCVDDGDGKCIRRWG